MKEQITLRSEPCNCGCKGRDPWHARRMRREVRGVIASEEVQGESEEYQFLVIRRGRARFPWGIESVEQQGIRCKASDTVTELGWRKTND